MENVMCVMKTTHLKVHCHSVKEKKVKKIKILVVRPTLAEWFEKQKDLFPSNIELIVPKEGTDEEIEELIQDVEIVVCTRLSAEAARKGKKLKLIQKTGAGVDAIPFEAIREEIIVANTSGANPVPLAEGTIALMISLAKKITQKNNSFPERDILRGTELRGKKVGIIGLGSIGIEVAKRLQAFEMKILGIKRRPTKKLKEELGLEFLGGSDDLDYVLKESDFVLVIVPLTPATRGMIGERELKLMKSTAYLVNVARAAIIQEEPMYRAVKEEWIAGAALDVWWIPHWWDPKWGPELDKPSRYPIWELPNVITTPHNVGFVERTTHSERAIQIIAENIQRIAQGKTPINLVDKEHQY
ncbi:MAG: hypothetical protein FK732_01210 [Asgard group archaeon]|nr:hypothetical protein [Asgard group archaeon]